MKASYIAVSCEVILCVNESWTVGGPIQVLGWVSLTSGFL